MVFAFICFRPLDMRISTEPLALIALNYMKQRTFVAALLLPHSSLKAILRHPVLFLKPDSLATDPFSYLGHLVGVIDFKDICSSDYLNRAILSLLVLRGDW